MDPFWVIVLFGLYVAPSLIAAARRPVMTLFVMALNVLLGWTIVGWFASLALAMLLPPAAASSVPAAPPSGPQTSGERTPPPLPAVQFDFVRNPMGVAALSLIGPIVYQLWWFWRFFELAQRQRFPRSRSFWWIFVPFYGWAVVGRLFHDLETRLGPSRPVGFSAQAALALVVASDVSAGWTTSLHSIPLIVAALALSGVFSAIALYQVQTALNAYLQVASPTAPKAGFSAGDAIAVAGGLALLSLLVLGGAPNASNRHTPSEATPTAAQIFPSSSLPPSPSPTPMVTPAPIPMTGDVLSMTSQPGDYIGQGRSTTMTAPAWRLLPNVSDTSDTVTVSFETVDTANFTRWTVWLAAPRGQVLHPGTYVNATRAAFRADSSPGIDVFGDGRGCNNVYGSFSVTKVTMDQQGKVQSFEATFEQHCESPTAPALHGYVRFGIAASDSQALLETRSLG
ncbi:MAG TPA: superinfection immunity protein [Candidatus Angelobacter sp.]|nr:superinfection immunity protein [Candidatus Angelobacter sp.]